MSSTATSAAAANDTASVPVVLIEDQGPVRIISLNRPDKMNAMSTALLSGLRDALEAADADEAVRALVLTGRGRGFSAGADLGEFRGEQSAESAKRNALRSHLMSTLQVRLRTLAKPIVAAAHGAAVGGGAAFAISCDMLEVGTNLKFGYPELIHGVARAAVLTALLKQVGPKAAFELMTLGATLTADDVQRLGLANRVVAPEEVLPTALGIARVWADCNPAQLAATKNMFYRMAEMSFADGLALGRDISAAMRNLPPAKH